ncbi:MAG: glycosyltransferase family 39 protein [Candidatus Levybacteria bacterium]|nr:glycosyltransferase family 39 protein [Candidatus Levybacteria bacterium]
MNKILRSLLFFFIGISLILRLYNLNWGAPYYFHPDERNIASAVTRLHFPDTLNPEFFAYGSLPIYTIYFTGLLYNFFSSCHLSFTVCSVTFEQSIIISRIFSVLFSLGLLPLLYVLGKQLRDETTGIIAVLLGALSVGFIQFAHFGTFEMWLTFFGLLLFLLCIKLLENQQKKYVIFAGIVLGILIAVKISSLVLIPLPFLALFFSIFTVKQHKRTQVAKKVSMLTTNTLMLFGITLCLYILSSPFVFLDYSSLQKSIKYESSVALGTLPVFYTGEFYKTIPIVYQFLHVYPFLLNPIVTILFLPAFFYMVFTIIKTKKPQYILLATCYLLLFFSQAILFVKWVRYMIPTLPFMYLLLAIMMSDMLDKTKNTTRHIIRAALIFIVLISSIFGISYFITAFGSSDTRINASQWGREHIPHDAQILSEVYDLGIVPFNSTFSNITLFNMYDLDNDNTTKTQNDLAIALQKADYIILPSQRIVQVRTTHQKQFPKGYMFYSALLNKTLSFTKVYETRCDIFCTITYLNDPIFAFEQTANVFDRPVVMIFKKYANKN